MTAKPDEPDMNKTLAVGTHLENFPGSDVEPDEMLFLRAIEEYKRLHNRRYPSWREVLMIAHCLGYRKVATPEELPPKPKRGGKKRTEE